MSNNNPRVPRENETREADMRDEPWTPPQTLPEPMRKPGFVHRFVRLSITGEVDATNYDMKHREGYRMTLASEQPHIQSTADPRSRFAEGVLVGGLLLMEIPEKRLRERDAYYKKASSAQIEAVDNNYMKESDSRMPVFRDRESKTTFGGGTA